MTWLEGRTEGGTVLPVQITDDGRLVAQGLVGGEGPPGPPGEQGPQGPKGEYGPGDDVDLGSGTFAGSVTVNDPVNVSGSFFGAGGGAEHFALDTALDSTPVLSVGKGNVGYATITAGGSATFKGNVLVADVDLLDTLASGVIIDKSGQIVQQVSTVNDPGLQVAYQTFYGSTRTAGIYNDGSVQFAGTKCGFTGAGELFFTSRGTRYKLEVAGGLCNAIPYTREMELRERVEDKRKPRPTDSVPED